MEITQELIKNHFEYHQDGYLTYKIRRQRCNIGDKAGYLRKSSEGNRRKICLNYKTYYASRLIFLYHKGYLPEIVDHKDNNTENDRIDNLRDSDASKNQYNKSVQKNSSSKYLGVYWNKKSKKWMARIKFEKKCIYLGCYISELDAAISYNNAAIVYHKEFANLNEIHKDMLGSDINELR